MHNPLCAVLEWSDLHIWAADVYDDIRDLELRENYDLLEIEAFIEEHRLFGADEKNLLTFEFARQRSHEIRRIVDLQDEKGYICPIELHRTMDILNRIDRDIRIAKSAILQRSARRGIFAPNKQTVRQLEYLGKCHSESTFLKRLWPPKTKLAYNELKDLDACFLFFLVTNEDMLRGRTWLWEVQLWVHEELAVLRKVQECKAAVAWCALDQLPHELRRGIFNCLKNRLDDKSVEM